MKNITVISLILLLMGTHISETFSQELPPIVNYPKKIYGGANQNWNITQAQSKHIYVANNDGLLEYNGEKWQLYPSANRSILRSVCAVKERIYSGSYMDFGYWEKDSTNSKKYRSITQSLDLKMIEDEQIWTILPYNNRILFQSLHQIYIYNVTNNQLTTIKSTATIHKMYKVDDVIYFQVQGEGIYKINEGKKELVNAHKIVQEDVIVNMFTKEEELLLVSRSNGVYKLKNNVLKSYNSKLNDLLKSYNIYTSIQLEDYTMVLGTISNGIFHISAQNEILAHINQYNGLSDNTALSLFEDIENNIWVGLDNGIDCINMKSPFTNYIDRVGRLGTVYASILHEGNIYLGTNQGLFFKTFDTNEAFRLIPGTEGQVWCLKQINNELFCGHNSGTYLIKNDRATQIANTMGTWDVQPIKNNPSLLLQGNYTGLYILSKNNGTWELKNKLKGFDISSRYFQQIANDQILVSHEYKGVYKLKRDTILNAIINVTEETSVTKGANSSLVQFDGTTYYANEKGIYNYLESNFNTFKKNTQLSKIYENDTYVSGKLVTDAQGALWAFTKNYMHYITKETISDEFVIKKIAIPTSLREEMKGFENITKIYAKNYLFGTSNGYLQLDVADVKEKKYEIQIHKVTSGITKNNNIPVSVTSKGEFDAKHTFISFEYGVPEYNKYLEAEYQFILEGSENMNHWSQWSTEPSVSFENLKYGDYTFKVKSRINNKEIETKASYNFTIARPWYVSNTAIVIYLLCIIAFFTLINWLYKRYYKYQRQRLLEKSKRESELNELEIQKELIELRNDKLQQDIEARNRELAISTMSMIKRNNVLNDLKEEIKKLDDTTTAKSLIKKINASINDREDWQFFEEAFNHADKDFFKKVKEIHPELTANDLRLCVYLRLNLSSKEIAPLLNISPRSVEIKRYRLRKKIHLSKEVNLNNYFIEL